MIIHNLSGNFTQTEKGKQINIRPDSGGPKIRTLRLAIACELTIDEEKQLFRAHIGKLKSGLLMAFPENKLDNRYFVISGFSHWKHRTSVNIDSGHTTATIVEKSHGYGAWGSGVAFFAILEDNQVIVSSRHGDTREVIYIENGEAIQQRMDSAEFAQFVGNIEVEEYL